MLYPRAPTDYWFLIFPSRRITSLLITLWGHHGATASLFRLRSCSQKCLWTATSIRVSGFSEFCAPPHHPLSPPSLVRLFFKNNRRQWNTLLISAILDIEVSKEERYIFRFNFTLEIHIYVYITLAVAVGQLTILRISLASSVSHSEQKWLIEFWLYLIFLQSKSQCERRFAKLIHRFVDVVISIYF